MIKLLKYIFISYFIILIYAMIRGRAGLKDNPTLIEEYVFIVCLFVCLDVLLWILKRRGRQKQKSIQKIKSITPNEKNRLALTNEKRKQSTAQVCPCVSFKVCEAWACVPVCVYRARSVTFVCGGVPLREEKPTPTGKLGLGL